MFKIGDTVMLASNGICEIKDIVEMDLSGESKEYFLLEPIDSETSKVYIPIMMADQRMRKVMNREEAEELIRHMEEIEEIKIENEKEREKKYKEIIQSCDPEQLVSIIKNIYFRREDRLMNGKKTTAIDEKYFKLASHNFHAEIAFALGCKESEVVVLIKEKVSG